MLPILSCVDNIVHKMIDLKVTIGQGHNNVYEFILFQSFLLFSNSDVHQSKDFKIIVWKKNQIFSLKRSDKKNEGWKNNNRTP